MIKESTVAAISTPIGAGGVAMIRISGEESRDIVSKIFRSVSNKSVKDTPGYTARYGHVYDGERLIDEAIALFFTAPHSYTGEDVVELSVHGGVYIAKAVLRAAVNAGAKMAGPGEFTRRAFTNGKLDLTQAEAVMQLISSAGEQDHKISLSAREGRISSTIDNITKKLLGFSAEIAAFSDYPEEEIPQLDEQHLLRSLKSIEDELQKLLSTYDAGRIVREGIDTVIAGRPNVGKSTLMNMLSGCQRSIVTPVAGTTRDVVEETVIISDVRLRLADTAGLRETEDIVEKIGVQRTKEKIESAGLILAVFDASEPLNSEDMDLMQSCKNRPAIAIINKTDLEVKMDRTHFLVNNIPVVEISAHFGKGIEDLGKEVASVTGVANLDPAAAILGSERQRECAVRALDAVRDAVSAKGSGFTLDAVGVCLDDALAELYSLTGKRVTNEVVDEVFKRFCVGK